MLKTAYVDTGEPHSSEVEPCEDGARPVTGSLFIDPRSLFSIGAWCKPKELIFFFGGRGGEIHLLEFFSPSRLTSLAPTLHPFTMYDAVD